MKILVDMSLSPHWASFLQSAGWEAIHVFKLEPRLVKDAELAEWARAHSFVLFTNDLDFGAALKLAGTQGPSIFQCHAHNLMPLKVGPSVVRTLREMEALLERGALVLVDMEAGRAKVFPVEANTDRTTA